MLSLTLRVAGYAFLRGSKSLINPIASYSGAFFICILVIYFDVLLDVARASILLVTVLESVHATLKQRLVIAKD